MFENILLIYSEKLTEKHLSVVGHIRHILENEFEKQSSVINVRNLEKRCFNGIDLVLTAGGDGTVIRASHYLQETPLLGINSESEFSEGALTSLKDDELELFREILKGNYRLIQRQRAQVKRNNKVLDELALNEVYVGTEKQFQTSRYVLGLNGEKEEQRSSGVLVATGSGSHAWYKSAGGEPFDYNEKRLRFLVREPYQGNVYRPKFLKGEIQEKQKISFKGKRFSGGVLAIDSDKVYDFNNGDLVEISLSDHPLNIVASK